MAVEIRGCRAGEQAAVIALTNRIFRPGGGDMGAEYPLLFQAANPDCLRIAVEDGTPVAHVGVCVRDLCLLGAPLRVASIGAVGTDPAHRGRGLASALMADVRQYARTHGASLMLISGGRGLYHRLGYVNVGRFERYQIAAGEIAVGALPSVTAAPFAPADLPAVATLHQAEPVRFLRPAADWRALLQAGMLMNRPAELLVVRQEDRPVAYLGVQQPQARAGEEGVTLRIQEMAGARSAMLAALPALLERYGATHAAFVTSPSDHEMAALARAQGWRPALQAFSGTLGVIDPPRLLQALQPLLAERVEAAAEWVAAASEEAVTFTWRGARYEVPAPGPLAALLFGGETEEARALPPAPDEWQRLLAALFPLPLVWPGYNYV